MVYILHFYLPLSFLQLSSLCSIVDISNNNCFINKLGCLISNNNIKLFCTHAHVGGVGNELADKYANDATNKPIIDIVIYCNKHYIKKNLNYKYLDLWSVLESIY